MCEMIRGGTTCFNDMYFHLPDAIDVFTPSGMRGVMGVPVFAFPSADGKCPEDYLKLVCSGPSNEWIRVRTFWPSTRTPILFWPSPSPPMLPTPFLRPYINKPKPSVINMEYPLWLLLRQYLPSLVYVLMHTHVQETADELNNSIANNKGVSCHLSEQKCSPIAVFSTNDIHDSRTLLVWAFWTTSWPLIVFTWLPRTLNWWPSTMPLSFITPRATWSWIAVLIRTLVLFGHRYLSCSGGLEQGCKCLLGYRWCG